jgi:hypothetical protein
MGRVGSRLCKFRRVGSGQAPDGSGLVGKKWPASSSVIFIQSRWPVVGNNVPVFGFSSDDSLKSVINILNLIFLNNNHRRLALSLI